MFEGRRRRRERDAAVHRGRQLAVAGDDQAQLDFLADALSRFPEEAEFWLLLAAVNLVREPDLVASQASKAAELGSDDPDVQVRAGHLLLASSEVPAATACATRARELVGAGFVLLAGLEQLEGTLLSLRGRYDAAERLLRAAVEREPEYPGYPARLARFLNNRGRRAEAFPSWTKRSDDLAPGRI